MESSAKKGYKVYKISCQCDTPQEGDTLSIMQVGCLCPCNGTTKIHILLLFHSPLQTIGPISKLCVIEISLPYLLFLFLEIVTVNCAIHVRFFGSGSEGPDLNVPAGTQ